MTDQPVGLVLHKHADRSNGERLVRYDPISGEKRLVNPNTPGEGHEPWPLKGVTFEGDAPALTTITPGRVAEGISEGWISTEGAEPVVRPAGPTQDQLLSSATQEPHLFIHYDKITFHMLDGDYTYKVVHQPDKYVADKGATAKVTPEIYEAGNTRVDNFYVIKLEG